nr:hypothetical protein GCM10020092_103840 [Actinoplanes digitatis]
MDVLLFTVSFWATYRLPAIPPVHDDGAAERPTAGVRGIVDGLRFLVTQPVLLLSFAVDIVAMVLAMPRALFPEIAEDRFGGGSAVGWLFSAIAIGSLARRPDVGLDRPGPAPGCRTGGRRRRLGPRGRPGSASRTRCG